MDKRNYSKERLDKLKILLTALYDTGYERINLQLFMYVVFIIEHYLDKKPTEPRVFGYNFYVHKTYGVFTLEVLIDLERIGVLHKEEVIVRPFHHLVKKYENLYNKFKSTVKEYVIPYEDDPDELRLYILECILRIHPGQTLFYQYVPVRSLI